MAEELSLLILTRVVQILYGDEEFVRERKGRLKTLFENTLLLPSLHFLAQAVPTSAQNRAILDCFEAFVLWAPFPSDHLIGIERQLLLWKEVEVLEAYAMLLKTGGCTSPHCLSFL